MKLLTIDDVLNEPAPFERELKALFNRDDKLLILDIGACTGEDSIRYVNLFKNASVIAFEPLPNNTEVMREHISKFGKNDSIKVEEFGLSDEDGKASFYVSGGSPYNIADGEFTTIIPKEWNKSSSLLKPAALMKKEIPWLDFDTETIIITKRLDTYLIQNKIKDIDFIHVDVQGAEMKVLLGIGEFIQNVKAILIEVENVELYEKQPLKYDIQHFLLNRNFRIIKDTSLGQTSGDCFFINVKYFTTFFRIKYFFYKLRSFLKNL